jgi:hypothetical protein
MYKNGIRVTIGDTFKRSVFNVECDLNFYYYFFNQTHYTRDTTTELNSD